MKIVLIWNRPFIQYPADLVGVVQLEDIDTVLADFPKGEAYGTQEIELGDYGRIFANSRIKWRE